MVRAPRRLVLIGVLVGAAALATAAVSGSNARDEQRPTGGSWRAADARAFAEFPLYWLGESFEGLPLMATTRRDDARRERGRPRADYVGFIYGDCAASDESGCAPPLEIQVWPACERSLADYALTPAGDPLPYVATVVRGVPGAYFEERLRLELYTGTVTVVVFGLDPDRVTRAAAALRAANALASSAPMLPPPAAGAMTGGLACE